MIGTSDIASSLGRTGEITE